MIYLILELFKIFIKYLCQLNTNNFKINIIKKYIFKLFNCLELKKILFCFLILFLLNCTGDYKNENTFMKINFMKINFMKINFIVSCIIYFIIDYIISLIIKLKNWAFEENVENRLSLIHGVSLIMITIIGGEYTFL